MSEVNLGVHPHGVIPNIEQENTHTHTYMHLKCIKLYLKQASVSTFNKQLLSWRLIYQVVLGNGLVHGIAADAVREDS